MVGCPSPSQRGATNRLKVHHDLRSDEQTSTEAAPQDQPWLRGYTDEELEVAHML